MPRQGDRQWVSYCDTVQTTDPADQRKAKRFANTVQAKIEGRCRGGVPVKAGPITVRQYAASWIQKRRDADLDWKNDQGRLKHHVLPLIGDLVLANVRALHIVDRSTRCGFRAERKLAQRSIYGDPRIPAARQLVYAFGVLAGMRPDEAAALRWRHWDPSVQPLRKLLVAASYNTRKHRAKGTKTDVVRHVPVHPTLAAMLAEWRLSGWAAMTARGR